MDFDVKTTNRIGKVLLVAIVISLCTIVGSRVIKHCSQHNQNWRLLCSTLFIE